MHYEAASVKLFRYIRESFVQCCHITYMYGNPARIGIHQIYYEHHHVSCVCLAHVAHMTKGQIGTM